MNKNEFLLNYIIDVKIRINNREECYEFQRIVTANYLRDNVTGWEIKTYAVEAVQLADELLKQLETQAD